MKTSSIRIEGSIISPEVFDKLDSGDVHGQGPADFGLEKNTKVKDDIARAWADAKDQWNIFKRRIQNVKENSAGVEETRKFWMVPFLENLGYTPVYKKTGETVNEKLYALSHADGKRDEFPLHIVGFRDNLDKRRETGGPRMSPHALLQEYLNVTEHLYGLVTNGIFLRLLRDSGKLVRLSYLEFNLERMLEDDLYAEFSLMYRIIHASRMPLRQTETESSIIEQYHQDALESGSRIRERLSNAVESSIKEAANGFLAHPLNHALRESVANNTLAAEQYYLYLLRFIYRLLFLMVIEERDLIYPDSDVPEKETPGAGRKQKDIYYKHYSVSRLRRLSEKVYLFDERFHDLWLALKSTFRIFESEQYGKQLGIYPLGGDLFSPGSTGILSESVISNRVLLECIRNLSIFENPDGKTTMRVNYAALNVEEFGSVYEGLLEYDGRFTEFGSRISFEFVKSTARSSSGSHYTPEELVQPLIKHSLDYIIHDRLDICLKAANSKVLYHHGKAVFPGIKKPSEISGITQEDIHKAITAVILKKYPPETGKPKQNLDEKIIALWNNEKPESRYILLADHLLLDINVCDAACGSGHILLSAARRIAIELARVRTGEDQPPPKPYRRAVRDVINNCIYGVDKNPLAVELCKVALWLEAYNPGMPLSFLDHRIKCGDSIVGLARREELLKGIAAEAFKKMPGDDPAIIKELMKRHKNEQGGVSSFFDEEKHFADLGDLSLMFSEFTAMPELTLEDVKKKAEKYDALKGAEWWLLHEAADMQTAQFFIPKIKDSFKDVATHSDYVTLFSPEKSRVRNKLAKAMAVSRQKRFFHWFLEFPEVMQNGGFDCILGNPPFLGSRKINTSFGEQYYSYLRLTYSGKGKGDLAAYFFILNYDLIRNNGIIALISTSSISTGDNREIGLEQIINTSGNIIFAKPYIPWPGLASVEVSLISLIKGRWAGNRHLAGRPVKFISSYLDDSSSLGSPKLLFSNSKKSFIGSYILGPGFILPSEDALEIIRSNPKYAEVLSPYLNGEDLNSQINQEPSRWVINFYNWEEDYCRENYPKCFEILEKLVKPQRQKIIDEGKQIHTYNFWEYWDRRPQLYESIAKYDQVLVIAQMTKPVAFAFTSSKYVLDSRLIVFSLYSYWHFSVLQSNIHQSWAWKYGNKLESRLLYTPRDVFESFVFPFAFDSDKNISGTLEELGVLYYKRRQFLMQKREIGLTKFYNLFHNRDYEIDKKQIKPSNLSNAEIEFMKDINIFRELHTQMDNAVLAAYGWTDINLAHDFYEVDYLPENDRVRFTISPEARKEVLRRLLELNHKIHAEEVAAGLWEKKKTKNTKTPPPNKNQPGLFG